jgi:Amt family ammonium transporter
VRIDDALDLFAEHAVGGIIGLLLNAFFASRDIIALDDINTSAVGGWLDQNWKQLYIQFAYICATCGYTFVVTALLAKCVDLIPGLHLRSTPEAEKLGMDEVEVRSFTILSHRVVTTWCRLGNLQATTLRYEGTLQLDS